METGCSERAAPDFTERLRQPEAGCTASTTLTTSPEAQGAQEYDGLSFGQHMLAGAVAGIVEHTAMFPVDTIKTRMQALAHPGQRLRGTTVAEAVRAVWRREGLRGLYGGIGAAAAGAGPAHALYFAVYEKAKLELAKVAGSETHPLVTGCAGVLATVFNDALATPLDVVKQRLQVTYSPYKGVWDCLSRVARTEGLRPFYRSYKTTLLMNAPYTAIYFSAYESGKRALGEAGQREGLEAQLVAGGIAGGTAAAATNPLDVVKTRQQLEGVGAVQRYSSLGVGKVLRQIVREEGSAALWSGLRPRVLFHVPASAICWGSYETMKSMLSRHDEHEPT